MKEENQHETIRFKTGETGVILLNIKSWATR